MLTDDAHWGTWWSCLDSHQRVPPTEVRIARACHMFGVGYMAKGYVPPGRSR